MDEIKEETTNEERDALANFAEAVERLRDSFAKAIEDIVNGVPQPPTPKKIDRCKGCVFKGEYQDMGATSPTCTLEHDLVVAVRAAECQEPCPRKFTRADAIETANQKSNGGVIMNIEKNGKTYTAHENKTSWTVSTTIGRVDVSYNVPKADCPTFDALKEYVAASDLF